MQYPTKSSIAGYTRRRNTRAVHVAAKSLAPIVRSLTCR